ncbi:MAG TPA: sulfurtransferase [Spirochaetia bacterium]|nr:sulfurtransferase [Spirochaetia bacterium]
MPYAHPEVLVETDWVKENIGKPGIRLVEVDVDLQAYDAGHIPGAVGFNWQKDLQDQLTRDIISRAAFEKLLGGAGISPRDTVVLYGDNNNWFAAYGFWLFKIYGHENVKLMNGGRQKWLNEQDKTFTKDKPYHSPVLYTAKPPNEGLRARLSEVIGASGERNPNLVDVRSNDEYTGKIIAPPGMSETAQRAGHIPGAVSVPWSTAVDKDGRFKSAEELAEIYLKKGGIDSKKPVIAYCRIGERSSHTWFVLKYLLGIENAKNYDGSWTEYGNLVAVPIEK